MRRSRKSLFPCKQWSSSRQKPTYQSGRHSHLLTSQICHIVNKFASSQTRQGRQVSRRGWYVNGYWEKLLPWTQEKYEKAKYYVTGTAMCAYVSIYAFAVRSYSRVLRSPGSMGGRATPQRQRNILRSSFTVLTYRIIQKVRPGDEPVAKAPGRLRCGSCRVRRADDAHGAAGCAPPCCVRRRTPRMGRGRS